MNDLDDLIRTSLTEHTPAGTPDDALISRVVAGGRRVRRVRSLGAAALTVMVLGGAAWGWAAFPRPIPPVVAATPAPSQPASVPPTPTPTEAPGVNPDVRDVSKMGAPSERDQFEYLANDFASPSGNFHCFISTVGAGCAGTTWDPDVEPSRTVCKGTEGGVMGPEIWGTAPAAWECGSDPHSLPFFYPDSDNSGVAWWDEDFGDKITDANDPTLEVAVLPYGKTLVAGDFSCTMATRGVTCTNSASGATFTASRGAVSLGK